MGKFKGTPGKWFLDESWIDKHVAISSPEHGAIALVLSDMDDDFTCNEKVRQKMQKELSNNAAAMVSAPRLIEALEDALEWIDSVPQDTVLPAMPGFDRDCVDALLKFAKGE